MMMFFRVSARNRRMIVTHVITVIVAFSYVVLGIVDSSTAEQIWAPYAVVILVLAIANLMTYKRIRNGKRQAN